MLRTAALAAIAAFALCSGAHAATYRAAGVFINPGPLTASDFDVLVSAATVSAIVGPTKTRVADVNPFPGTTNITNIAGPIGNNQIVFNQGSGPGVAPGQAVSVTFRIISALRPVIVSTRFSYPDGSYSDELDTGNVTTGTWRISPVPLPAAGFPALTGLLTLLAARSLRRRAAA